MYLIPAEAVLILGFAFHALVTHGHDAEHTLTLGNAQDATHVVLSIDAFRIGTATYLDPAGTQSHVFCLQQ